MSYYRDDDSFRTSTDIFEGFESEFSGFDAGYQPDDVNEYIPEEEKQDEPVKDKKKLRSSKKKKKKRKKKNHLLRLIIVVLVAVAMYFFLSSSIFDIEDIRVENNALLSDQEIISASGIEVGQNIFSVRAKGDIKKNPYVSDVDLDRDLPGRITIVVTEIHPAAAVEYRAGYILLDEVGDYVDVNDSSMYATVITGVEVENFKRGRAPEFKDPAAFREALTLINGFNNADMYLKRVEVMPTLTLKGYISDNLMCSGTSTAILSNIDNLKYILYDLDQKGIKRGIIRIGDDGYTSFSPVTE